MKTLGMGKGKQGFLPWLVLIIIAAIVGGIFWQIGTGYGNKLASSVGAETAEQQQAEAAAAGITEQDLASCNGISSVNALYNDFSYFAAATDPGTNLTVYSPIRKTVLDDATSTTVPIKSELRGLAGQLAAGTPSTGYFGQEVDFSTGCADINVQPELFAIGAPTLTFTNDNGVTLNADASAEAMSADTTYSPTLTVKSGSNACSAKYGALVVADYDASYIDNVDSPDLAFFTGKYREPKQNPSNGTSDVSDVFIYEGELCDGKKVDLTFDVTSHATTSPSEDNGVVFHWYPINKDMNADLNEVVTGIYDDKNNVISYGNSTLEYFVS